MTGVQGPQSQAWLNLEWGYLKKKKRSQDKSTHHPSYSGAGTERWKTPGQSGSVLEWVQSLPRLQREFRDISGNPSTLRADAGRMQAPGLCELHSEKLEVRALVLEIQ